MKKLPDLILKSLKNPDVIKKISESIVENLLKNEKTENLKLNKQIDNIEVIILGKNSKTLLKDYSNIESAVEEVIEKEIVPSITQKNKKNEYIR